MPRRRTSAPTDLVRRWTCGCLGTVLMATAVTAADHDGGLAELSLEELMRVPVISASRVEERLDEAPATVIVIDRSQIEERGYRDLSEVIEELPGMDLVRPYGATYLKNYWRGFRNNIGAPYLLMLDGRILNHLYFNSADVMVALPLSSIDRVEVVYGPASSVYGPNAFMGVIHVISDPDPPPLRTRLEWGDLDTRTGDVAVAHQAGDWQLRAAALVANSDVSADRASAFEYTRPRHYRDSRLWGDFGAGGRLGGQAGSPNRHRGVDLRARRAGLEVAAQSFKTSSGYGAEYAADQAQSRAVWSRYDHSLSIRWQHQLTARVHSTSLLRYRESGVDDDSYFVEGFEVQGPDGTFQRLVDYSLWMADNSSWSLFQDFEVATDGPWSLTTGFKAEQKDLQKAYATAYGPSLPPDQVDAATYPFPRPGDQVGPARNRITTDDVGVYGQARYRFSDRQSGHLGLRLDHNSEYGSATTIRAGYVATVDAWVFKGLYGEAFQEPNPRVLYGGWRGSGSDPDLDPEYSRTLELSISHTRETLRHHVSLFAVENQDTIVNVAGGAVNLGDRTVRGLDYHAEALPRLPLCDHIRLWLYYSHLFDATEERFAADRTQLADGSIGDLATDRATLGATLRSGDWILTAKAKWVDQRETVDTNPVRRVGSYSTADLYLRYRLVDERFAVGVTATNLFDEVYYHPGVREAASGDAPGFFEADGRWVGSSGFYNSLLPQPGRRVGVVLSFAL